MGCQLPGEGKVDRLIKAIVDTGQASQDRGHIREVISDLVARDKDDVVPDGEKALHAEVRQVLAIRLLIIRLQQPGVIRPAEYLPMGAQIVLAVEKGRLRIETERSQALAAIIIPLAGNACAGSKCARAQLGWGRRIRGLNGVHKHRAVRLRIRCKRGVVGIKNLAVEKGLPWCRARSDLENA